PRQAGGGAQLERLGLLPPGALQGPAEERLSLLDRSAENLCPQPVELGIEVVLSLLLSRQVRRVRPRSSAFVVYDGVTVRAPQVGDWRLYEATTSSAVSGSSTRYSV
ncbi:MAG TPA: hypothetical protein VN812_09335, partial [Candidatus Acidoferrales bacterium]|nr:hypothetical protein [Candidatus Acidoferrales bacterium]